MVATPNDGETDGSPVTSATVTVANSAPVATDVSLGSSAVYTNDTLTAVPSGSDADGDSITWTYAWYLSGSEVTGETSATLSGATVRSRLRRIDAPNPCSSCVGLAPKVRHDTYHPLRWVAPDQAPVIPPSRGGGCK